MSKILIFNKSLDEEMEKQMIYFLRGAFIHPSICEF